ncbi:MAG: TonB-dependent receptor [Campylobacterota bacterium]|nr:TonB-dependent receptor [Campylobacterota bacterium]
MKKIALSTSLALFLSTTVYGAEDMEAIEVVSVATKTAKNIDGVAATVVVVTQKEIQKMGAESLKDIIAKTPGINLQYGTFPSASSKSKSSISIRGMSANGTLFLIDGRRVAGEVANPYDLDRIPASVVQRIEIVKGPNSSLYGADAVGGVINIITKKPKDGMKIDAGIRYGMNEHSQAQNMSLNLSIQGKSDKFGYSVYSSLTTTDPYTQKDNENVWVPMGIKASQTPVAVLPDMTSIQDNYTEDVTYREDSQVYTLGTRLTYGFTSDLVAGLDVNYFNEEREGLYIGYFHPSNYRFTSGPNASKQVPVYNVPVNTKDENNRLDLSIDVAYAPTDDLEIKARIYNSVYEKRNTTSTKHYTDMGYASEDASEKNGMNADVDLLVGELSAIYLLNDAHLLSIGTEYRDEKRSSSVFTQSSGMTEKKVDYQSIYIQDEWEVSDSFNAILGARYDAISNAENKATYRLGGIYEFDKLAKLRVNFAQGYRTPDIREMYIHKQTPNGLQIGADVMGYDLKPESIDSFEIGLGGHNNKFSYDAVIFYNKVQNMIDQVMGIYNGNAAYTFENIADANTKGIELSLNYQITNNLSTNLFWTELKTENEKTKKDLEFQPERTVMLGLNYEALKGLDFGLVAKYIGEQHYTSVTNRGAPNETTNSNAKTKAFYVADFTANYEVSEMIEIYGGVNNIGDTTVEDVLGSSVGRYYFAGARVSF